MEYFDPNMFYSNGVQQVSTGMWPNAYQIGLQQQPAIPNVYYQTSDMMVQQAQQQMVPTGYYQMPTVAASDMTQVVPTVYYQPPTMTGPTITTAVSSEAAPTNTTTTTKTVTTRILEPTPVEEDKVQPRTSSTSSSSDISTTSSESTITPVPVNPVLPPVVPIHTIATVPPVRRVVHRPYTPSGYISSDLDYGRRKVYKTDYKYRHYYCCNVCLGRWDLRNRSYSCCEWFYGFPVWYLLLSGLLFLGLLAGFFTLLGLQPTLNPSRRDATAETRLLNRTQIIYGYYRNCGFQVNATVGTPTTLILCANTGTTTTARVELSPFYTVISGTNGQSLNEIFILFCCVIAWHISIVVLLRT